jgi:uncharacterized protein (DUF427 family)
MPTPEELARSMWRWRGQERPPFAAMPGADEESVWDYPRPPRIAADARHVVVRAGDCVIADTRRSVRVLETAGPPTFYLPPEDCCARYLVRVSGVSHCEWKGAAGYWNVETEDGSIQRSAWSYHDPAVAFSSIRDWFSFYPASLDCRVDGVRVRPQPGSFYGGWVTPEICGPMKGDPGSSGW